MFHPDWWVMSTNNPCPCFWMYRGSQNIRSGWVPWSSIHSTRSRKLSDKRARHILLEHRRLRWSAVSCTPQLRHLLDSFLSLYWPLRLCHKNLNTAYCSAYQSWYILSRRSRSFRRSSHAAESNISFPIIFSPAWNRRALALPMWNLSALAISIICFCRRFHRKTVDMDFRSIFLRHVFLTARCTYVTILV